MIRSITCAVLLASLMALLLAPLALPSVTDEPPVVLTEAHVSELEWRGIGPASMGGRIVDLAVDPRNARAFYVACATGGVFKTTNDGTTFTAIFEDQGTASVGAIAVADSEPDTVWVGTGEANPRNSVSWGDGVYRSWDGGQRWVHCGLERTKHIGAIAIHPADARTVFVAVMGSTWGPNEERGLYRTRDGGESWERVLFVDERTGCIDVRVDPSKPDIVYAAMYERQRDEFDSNDPAVRTGPGSGLWRSLNGGDTWERLGIGLPTVAMGRIGLDLWAKDPRVLFAIVETERTGESGAPPRSEDRVSLGITGVDHEDGGFRVDSVREGESAAQAGVEEGDVITRIDAVEVLGRADLVNALAGYAPGDQPEIVFARAGEELTATLLLLGRLGRNARSFAGSQGGQVADAQDQQGADGFETGGVFRSDDRGTTWERINSLNPRPFYYSQVRVDPTDDRVLYVLGISMHRSTDAGKSFEVIGRGVHADHHALWIEPDEPTHLLLGNDGGLYTSWDGSETWEHVNVLPIGQFYNVAVDTRTPYRVYGGLQDNGTWGGPSRARGSGVPTSEWVYVNGGDGFRAAVDPTDPDLVYCERQGGALVRVDLRTGDRLRVARPGNGRGYRFNWNTPFLLSPHNASILFYAGDKVFRSVDGGRKTLEISPGITRTERGSATALAQSPIDEDTLYVGCDDGALWRTLDGGHEWTELTANLPGLDGPRYVSDIEPSPHRAATVYVVLDGHRSGDYAPHVFVSEDDGASFRSITAGLPEDAPVRTIAVDAVNPGLLFCGTEFGCFVSIDGGERWTPMQSGLPSVPVHDLVIHPSESDLVAGTHGRGVYICDIAPLQALSTEVLAGDPFLFPVQDVHRWSSPPVAERHGSRGFVARDPARVAAVYYYLPEAREEPVELVVRDALGQALRTIEGSAEAGLHRAEWDLRARREGGGARGRRGGGGGGFGGGGLAEPGDYSVTLVVGGEDRVRALRVLPDPVAALGGTGIAR